MSYNISRSGYLKNIENPSSLDLQLKNQLVTKQETTTSQQRPEELDRLKDDIAALHKEVININQNISDIETQSVIKVQEELRNASDKTLQSLSLFIGLFTFISIQFQLFAGSDKLLIIPLELIFVGILFLFLILFLHFSNSSSKKEVLNGKISTVFSCLAVLFILLGLGGYSVVLGQKSDCRVFSDNLKKVSIEEVEDNGSKIKSLNIRCNEK